MGKTIKYSDGLFYQMQKRIPLQENSYNLSDLQAITEYWDSLKLPKSTVFNAVVHCKTRGVIQVDLSDFETCNDDTCGVCSGFKNALIKLTKQK